VTATRGAETAVELRFPAPGRLIVRVTGAEGRPLEGALVRVMDADGHHVAAPRPEVDPGLPPDRRAETIAETLRRASRTDPSGICVRERVPSGSLTVRVLARGHRDAVGTVEVGAGATAELRLAMEPGESTLDRKLGGRAEGR